MPYSNPVLATLARAGYRALSTAAIILTAIAPAHAQGQQPSGRSGWPCEGKIDPTHVRNAEATGGKVMPFHPSEVGGMAGEMIAGRRHDETIFRMTADVADGAHEFEVPIDSTIESVYFFVALQCLHSATVILPSGEALPTSSPDVEYHEFRAIRLYVIRQPTPGSWKIAVAGRGFLSIIASAKTTLQLQEVTFEDEGRVVKFDPPRDKPQRLVLRTSGDAPATGFRFVSSTGATLQQLDLQVSDARDGDGRVYAGEVSPPRVDFRCAITGTDSNGFPFQRVQSQLIVDLR